MQLQFGLQAIDAAQRTKVTGHERLTMKTDNAPTSAPVDRLDAAVDFMDLVFRLCETVDSTGLTITEMTEVMKISVADGHDRIAIVLSMAGIAIENAKT